MSSHFPHPSQRLIWDWKGLLSWLWPRLQLSSQHRDGIRWTGPERHTHNFTQMETHPPSPSPPSPKCTTEVRILLEYFPYSRQLFDVKKKKKTQLWYKISSVWSTTYRRCVRGPGDTGSRVSGESRGASEGPGRTALLHCRDNPGTSERPLRKHVGDSQPTTRSPVQRSSTGINNNKVSFIKSL